MWFWAKALQCSFPHWARTGLLAGMKHFWWASDPSPYAEASSVEKGHQADIVASTPGLEQVSAWIACVGPGLWSKPFMMGLHPLSGSRPAWQHALPAPCPIPMSAWPCIFLWATNASPPGVSWAVCAVAPIASRGGSRTVLGVCSRNVRGHRGRSSCRVWSRIAELRANPYVRPLLSGSIPTTSPQPWGRTFPHPFPLTLHFISGYLVKNLSEAAASKTKPRQGSSASERLRSEGLTSLVGWCKPEPRHGRGVTGVNKRMLLRGQNWCCWGRQCKQLHLKLQRAP